MPLPGFEHTSMSDAMRRRLQRSDYIFSGMKTFHELNEAFPSLADENGNRKPFEQFLNEVQSIDQTYNVHYLRAEYNFIQSSAEMASKWEHFIEDGDRYNLQYRTAKDDKVRPEHAALEGVTLPPSDPFWEEYYPPNGWNCRCTVVQVLKSKYPATDPSEAMALGAEALQRDTKGMFRFNPGIQGKSVPDYNPYTIRRCQNCDVAKGKTKLAGFIPDNELCSACRLLHRRQELTVCTPDKDFGNRLLISNTADTSELEDNLCGAKSILSSCPDVDMTIRGHIIEQGVKNPEYTINGRIADRKGIKTEKGITAGFVKAIKQNCSAIVIDLDMHMRGKPVKLSEIAKRIDWRKNDFESGTIAECYVIHNDKAVKITLDDMDTRASILNILQKLRP